jgi:glucokinase-like ROK family protein
MINRTKKVDAVEMNLINKREILHLIRKAGEISRADIVNLTGLTAPTVSRIVEHLVKEDKLVNYVGIGESSGGRPPVMLQFNGKENFVIGIDLGATTIRGVLSDLDGNFIMEIQIATNLSKGYEIIMDQVGDLVQKLLNKRDFKKEKVKGVGIGLAGLVNKKNGIVDFSPDFGWNNVNVKESLQKRLPIPFIYDNSSRLMALGELEFGQGSKYENFVVINVGYGIAAGIVADRVLIKGAIGYAGEFGHTIADSKSNIRCKCGAMGCLEAVSSGSRIAQLGQELVKKRKNGILLDLCQGDISKIDAKLVANAAGKGDKDAQLIYEEITSYISAGVANLSNLLDPEIIFFGGGVSLNGDIFFKNITNAIKKHLISPVKSLKIAPVTFGDYASLMGALSLISQKIINFEPFSLFEREEHKSVLLTKVE